MHSLFSKVGCYNDVCPATMQHTDSKCISQDVKKLITAGLT